jgi:hypothetical protein
MPVLTNKAFVDALFRDMDERCAATFHSFTGDPKDAKGWPARAWKKGKPLPTFNPFANNYVCVSSFNSTPDNKFYRRKILFSALHCVMIDDLGTKLPMSDLKLKPSVLIETSPGNFQAWLFFERPIDSLPAAETLINQMIAAGISAELDPGMRGVTRVARLPVGANGKLKYRSETGAVWPQRVAEADLDRRYTPSDIAEAYGLDLTPRREPPPPERPRTGVERERLEALQLMRVLGMHKECLRPGYHEIVCPWLAYHSDGAATGTYYTEPEGLNSWQGGFMCHHGHCGERDINDLIGYLRAEKDNSIGLVVPKFISDWKEDK